METICCKDHPLALTFSLTQLYKNTELIDCVLDTDGGLLKAHRVILGACSPYLKKLLMDHQGVSLKQVKYKDMKNILDFMYYGEIDVLSNEVPSIMKTAKFLQISLFARDSVKIEEQEKQDDLTCSAAADVEDIIEEYPYNSEYTCKEGNVKLENKFLTESLIKMESEDDLDVYELNSISTKNIYMTKSLESSSVSTIHPVNSETKDSSDGKSLYVNEDVQEDPERNVVQIYQNMTFDEALINDHNKDQCVARTEHSEIQFESFFDASEFVNKAEDSAVSGLDSENIDELDNKSSSLKPLHVILKDEPVELDDTCENQVAKNSSYVVNSSKVMLKEARVVLERVSLQGVYPSLQTEIGNEASAFRGNLCSLNSEEENEFNKTFEEAETFRSEQGVTVFSPDKNYEGKCNPSLEKGFLGDKPQSIFVEGKSHKRVTHFHKIEKSFSCYVCEKYFREKKHLKEHIRCHSAEKSFSCKLCNAGFTCISNLQRHMRTHTSEKVISSDACKASFSQKIHLKKDRRTHTCDVCEASFSRKSCLKEHKRIHTGDKPYSCDVCQACFCTKGNLKRHIGTHTGEKLFPCNVCETSFSRKWYLKLHMRTHTGEKPFSCGSCEASFSFKSNLENHKRTHTGENLFCRDSRLSFSAKSNLERNANFYC